MKGKTVVVTQIFTHVPESFDESLIPEDPELLDELLSKGQFFSVTYMADSIPSGEIPPEPPLKDLSYLFVTEKA